jgi:flavin reductase (DIM6/NTAB) family NADH-FMN oxidoreductase RutF
MLIEGEAKVGKDLEGNTDQAAGVNGVTDKALRRIRGLFASGVTVVTTAHAGRLHGLTVSAFSAVSLDPPLVLVCIGNEAAAQELITASGIFAVNVLSDEQEFLSERFAARAPIVNEKFEGVPYHVAATGAPILEESIAWYDCRLAATHQGGDHVIFMGKVEAIGFGAETRRPLLYFANRYAGLEG